jgi:uncharacterized protein YndB with AHSA1/START domain
MKPSDRVLVEILIAAPIDVVWRALREPSEIKRWFGWECPSLAEEIAMIFAGDSLVASEVDHTLHAPGIPDRFALEANGDHTIVRLIRSAPVTDASWQGIYDDVVEGWLTFLQQLRFTLERHRGADRRTLYLNGRARDAKTPLPADAFGHSRLTSVPMGQRYALSNAIGDRFEGSIWFRSSNQIGLTVDAYGDGLIILGTRPRTDRSPHGGGSAVITIYGFDQPAFAGLRDRWRTWWENQYELIELQPQ